MLKQRAVGGALILLAGFLFAEGANAFDFGDMMNPSKWMGGGKNRHRDEGPWGGPGYGGYYGGPPPAGYGYGYRPYGPGYGYGGAPVPGYGYGAPGYPAGVTPYGASAAPAPRPAARPE